MKKLIKAVLVITGPLFLTACLQGESAYHESYNPGSYNYNDNATSGYNRNYNKRQGYAQTNNSSGASYASGTNDTAKPSTPAGYNPGDGSLPKGGYGSSAQQEAPASTTALPSND